MRKLRNWDSKFKYLCKQQWTSGNAVKEIVEIAHKEEIENVRLAQMMKFNDAK